MEKNCRWLRDDHNDNDDQATHDDNDNDDQPVDFFKRAFNSAQSAKVILSLLSQLLLSNISLTCILKSLR
jgi:hypothetical protein